MIRGITRKDGILTIGGIRVDEIAKEYDTPLYIYDLGEIAYRFNTLSSTFTNLLFIAFSVKSNNNAGILRVLAEIGSGADVVSGGELEKAILTGFPPSKTVFSGVGKTTDELDYAVKNKIFSINVETEGELQYLSEKHQGARVAIRVNPGIEAHSKKEIVTGSKWSKFGIPVESVIDLCNKFKNKLQIIGFSFHLGSQIPDPIHYQRALDRILPLLDCIPSPEMINIGGGFPVNYDSETDSFDFIKRLSDITSQLPLPVIIEPGRFLVARAGILVSRVLYIKRMYDRTYAILDAGMNDFVRPALYKIRHRIVKVISKGLPQKTYSIAGPICENTDIFDPECEIEELKPGDLVAILDTGAYGYVMSSNYNLRPRPPEIVVYNGKHQLIRPRENLKQQQELRLKIFP